LRSKAGRIGRASNAKAIEAESRPARQHYVVEIWWSRSPIEQEFTQVERPMAKNLHQ
jgi:hypothetical protein